ncbi:MAG: alpha/beta fold hydrolase [Elusimicrobia bacterium]|nr:alpha/beta fold hydrolase [Elusimicrobiota bacterium]
MPLSPLLEPLVRYSKAAEALAEGPKTVRLGRTPKKLVRRDGRTSLYRYGVPARRARGAAPVLLVYALINRPTIMDLLPGRSIVEVLRAAGLDVWLLDWGVPGPEAAGEGLDEHVMGYLHRAVEAVRKGAKAPKASLFGYCMGGTLSVMYAALEPARVARLLAAVAPIRGRQSEGFIHFASDPALFNPGLMTLQGNVAPEALNAGFMMLRPVENMLGKYVRYFEKAGEPGFDELFFAMERWVSEGQPLPGRLYREFVRGVYQEDLLVTTGVPVGARRARAADVRCPVAVVSSAQDHLVPPSSTQALLDLAASREKKRFDFPGGHVGLAISPKALATVWKDAAAWLGGSGKPRSKGLKPKMRRGV